MNAKAVLKMMYKNIEQWTITLHVVIIVFMLFNSFNGLSAKVLNYLLPIKNRELGLVEGLQHLTLFIGCVVMLIATLQSATNKVIYALLTCFVFFIFLEEVDYFIHYIDLVFSPTSNPIKTGGFRNLHNQTHTLRKVGYLLVVYGLVMLLLYKGKQIFSSQVSKSTLLFTFVFIQLVYPLLLWIFKVDEDPRQVYSELRELCLYVTGLCVMVRITHNH